MKKNILIVAAVALGIAFFEVGVGLGPPPHDVCELWGWGGGTGTNPPRPLPSQILGIIFTCCLMKGIRSGYEVM